MSNKKRYRSELAALGGELDITTNQIRERQRASEATQVSQGLRLTGLYLLAYFSLCLAGVFAWFAYDTGFALILILAGAALLAAVLLWSFANKIHEETYPLSGLIRKAQALISQIENALNENVDSLPEIGDPTVGVIVNYAGQTIIKAKETPTVRNTVKGFPTGCAPDDVLWLLDELAESRLVLSFRSLARVKLPSGFSFSSDQDRYREVAAGMVTWGWAKSWVDEAGKQHNDCLINTQNVEVEKRRLLNSLPSPAV